MRILTYKRTHTGDPNLEGVFGVNDCMGSVRGYEYDAVIGVGGIGADPRGYNIDGKITWVGIHPTKVSGAGRRGPTVTFQSFILFDEDGPSLAQFAPALAKRVYDGKVRYLLKNYSHAEMSEAERVVEWAKQATAEVVGKQAVEYDGVRLRCVCNKRGRRQQAT